MAFADSSRIIINVEEDVFADKSTLNNPQSKSLMTGFSGTRTNFVLYEDNQKPHALSNKPLPITTYLKFDLNSIPTSTLFETVSIDESTLKLFFPEPDESDATLYVFTVSYCANDQWTDEEVFWDTRPCTDDLEAIDTTVIKEEEIPGFVELDIVGAINKAQEEEKSKITFALEAQPIQFDVDPDSSNIGKVTNYIQSNWNEIKLSDFNVNKEPLPDETFQGSVNREFGGIWNNYHEEGLSNIKYIEVSFVDNTLHSLNYTATNSHVLRIASSESEQLGHVTSPTIIIDYNISPSVFNDSIIFTLTIILPTLTIIVPLIIWAYKKSKKIIR